MQTRRAAGIGLFVILTGLLFVTALFMVGNRRMLFADTFTVYAEFRTLGGAQVGSQVRVAGMAAGEVKDIAVPDAPNGWFRVRMNVSQTLHGLVRADSVAVIRTEGLVGAQFVEIVSGTTRAPILPSGGTIAGEEPFEIADLMQQMSDTIRLVSATIEDLKGDVEETIGSVDQVAKQASGLLRDVSGPVATIVRSGAKVTSDLALITGGMREGRGTVGRLMTDDALAENVIATSAEARKAVEDLRQLVAQARQAMTDATGKDGAVTGMAGSLRETLEKTRETMDNLAADTEALKRNFLFRGYFDDRGYFNLAGISPTDYRRGVLEKGGRKPLRIWLHADKLFATVDGELRISDAGRQQIDSAMGAFLKYRNSAPLVVEGYADAASEADRYLRSRDRAALVRLYLVQRFQLDRSTTGIMALGAAEKSPDGDRWDGVALTVFVDGRALGTE
jgi:phospholipid/cholesterol/gamma-HCH transport system substrate-binding protein